MDVGTSSEGTEGTTIGYPLTTSPATYSVKVLSPFDPVRFGRQTSEEAADNENTWSNDAVTAPQFRRGAVDHAGSDPRPPLRRGTTGS
ncbi:hypothetical protein [Streptomyces canus]|uniref:hypothetical protein n=1 Tax=Streptomyces canus TaxID=58343 RepID=UPI0030DEDA1E